MVQVARSSCRRVCWERIIVLWKRSCWLALCGLSKSGNERSPELMWQLQSSFLSDVIHQWGFEQIIENINVVRLCI